MKQALRSIAAFALGFLACIEYAKWHVQRDTALGSLSYPRRKNWLQGEAPQRHAGRGLSLQSHKHRFEHWTVVSGTATVTVDDRVLTLNRSQSVDIPLGAKHRLENFGEDQVEIIEVQFGDYLGEDDMIRYDDVYSRT